jgi:hypothetical protein
LTKGLHRGIGGAMQVRLTKEVTKLVKDEADKQSRLNRIGEGKLGNYGKVTVPEVVNKTLFKSLSKCTSP